MKIATITIGGTEYRIESEGGLFRMIDSRDMVSSSCEELFGIESPEQGEHVEPSVEYHQLIGRIGTLTLQALNHAVSV